MFKTKVIGVILDIILWIWQLPQNIIGFILGLFFYDKVAIYSNRYATAYVSSFMSGGISLGSFVYVSLNTAKDKLSIKHECEGHVKQSLYLGPLYLLVIGIPSIIWACIYTYTRHNYYWFYTERWANRLAGII